MVGSTMKSVLLVVLPYRVGAYEQGGPKASETNKKSVRSFLAFPYGVLTIASYLKRYASNLGQVEILDMNLPDAVPLYTMLVAMKPDIVGFSMSYDVSYQHLKMLTAATRQQ